jgi:hypothetical protein
MVMVKDVEGSVVAALAERSEYQAPVLATLLTTTLWVPATVPLAAVAVTSELLEDVTVREAKGPVREFNDCMSVCIAVIAVCIAVSSLV